jgi:hypothetical protein
MSVHYSVIEDKPGFFYICVMYLTTLLNELSADSHIAFQPVDL